MSGIELMLTTMICINFTICTDMPSVSNDNLTSVSVRTSEPIPSNIYSFQGLNATEAKKKRLNDLRQYIKGMHLKIGTLEDYPLSYTEETLNGNRIGKGVSFEIIDFLAEKYNFSYEVIVPGNNTIGSSNDIEGSLIQLLNKTKIDLAAAFVPLLADPRDFIFYSTTVLDEGEWIMVMQRPTESATGSGLLAPFDKWVWVLILISLFAVGPIIYFLIIIRNKITGDDSQKPYSLSHCAWFVYGALMKQGSTLSPVADSTRLLFATWWIFITILTSFYTANLTAFLTLSKFTLPFNTVNDILNKQKHFVSVRGGGIEYAIKNTNESLSNLSKMVVINRAIFTTTTNDTITLTNYVEKSGYVFVRDRPAINHLLYEDYRYRKTISMNNEKIHCPFAVAKTPFLTKKRSFAYPINSNLSELFDPELLNLVESGIVKHLAAQSLPNAEICPQDLGGTERQLRNGDLMMTYYIMIAGFATAIVVFTTEMVFRFLNERRERINLLNGTSNDGYLFKKTKLSSWNTLRGQLTTKHSTPNHNTPPPPYTSIYSYNRNTITNMDKIKEVSSKNNYGNETGGIKRYINGRDYMVFRNPNGKSQLIPMHAPSATLFQYSYTE